MSVYSLNNHRHLPHAAIEPRSLMHESSPAESAITTRINREHWIQRITFAVEANAADTHTQHEAE